MKYSWKSYFEPTPKLIRRIADSVLVGAMSLSTATYFTNHTTAAFIILIIANIAKIASNFFSVENQTPPTI